MKSYDAISDWIIDYLARVFERDRAEIDPSTHFGDFGMDSAGAVGMSGDLSEWLGVELEDAAAFHFPSVGELAQHAASMLEQSHGA